MKHLLLLLLLTSCGVVEIPLFEKHGADHDNNSSSINTVGVQTVQAAHVAQCNMQARRSNCTRVFVGNRLLTSYELYSPYCWNQYNLCLNR